MDLELTGSGEAGISAGSDSRRVRLGYDFTHQQIFLDRRSSQKFHPDFPSIETASYKSTGTVRLKIVVDKYITEIFSDDGLVSLTDLTFFAEKIHIETFGNAKLKIGRLN